MLLVTDKHFTRKSQVLPSFVLISNPSNTKKTTWYVAPTLRSWWEPVPSFWPEKMSHMYSLESRKLRECFLWVWASDHTLGSGAKTSCLYIICFFSSQWPIFYNSATEQLCRTSALPSEAPLQPQLVTAVGQQRPEIQYNLPEFPVCSDNLWKADAAIPSLLLFQSSSPKPEHVALLLWFSVDIPPGLVWIRIPAMITAE